MIDTAYVTTMAHYNRWQNRSLYDAAAALSDEVRRQDRGAFFGSIHGTFCHILWADQIWLSRFAGTPKPPVPGSESSRMIAEWPDLLAERQTTDALIEDWAGKLPPGWLAGDLTWVSGVSHREFSKPKALAVMHFFNHQTHHRGQVHAMLTAAGMKPDDTDLVLVELRGEKR
ncbi:DinB family protein [Bosea vestrisii]|uniref:DinB family protein n=1 Tax=Bosea vestrisii TaxID=151416 RepID=UPI0024DFEB37|nr:DinB family protein [Bosea vestrisii]WID95412.1 DinB family protein [Bosea vestrisii]